MLRHEVSFAAHTGESADKYRSPVPPLSLRPDADGGAGVLCVALAGGGGVTELSLWRGNVGFDDGANTLGDTRRFCNSRPMSPSPECCRFDKDTGGGAGVLSVALAGGGGVTALSLPRDNFCFADDADALGDARRFRDCRPMSPSPGCCRFDDMLI